MSFTSNARRVRDRSLPYGGRYMALRYAVDRYPPLGFHPTWDYITGRAGDVRTDEAALLRALDILEKSRRAWHQEQADFARRLAEWKPHGWTVTAAETRYHRGLRWPGPDAHEATLRLVTTLWDEHMALAFPEVPVAQKPDLVTLDSTVAGIIWTYLRRQGQLHPDHRTLLRTCLTDLRAIRLAFSDAAPYFRRLRTMAELIAHDALPLIRRSWSGDAERISEIFLAARAEMTYLPQLHSDDETRAWIAEIVLPRSQVWVAELRGRVVGFASLRDHWLEHLYVAPEAQCTGVGAALLDQAKRVRRTLDLHVFQQNTGARRFYERHGFALVDAGDGRDNEEHVPDAHYRWSRPASGPSEASGLNASLTCAFPDALADEVTAVVELLPRPSHAPTSSFHATVGDDRVAVPERIYNPEPPVETSAGLSSVRQTILHCLYTRNHDGFVRQRHLKQIVGSLEPWVLPYIVRLLGEYVIEIVTDIQAALGDLDMPGSPAQKAYGRFLADNPELLAVTEQRVTSYWSCYHRDKFPMLSGYPGYQLVTAMRAAESATY